MQTIEIDVLVKGGMIVTMDAERRVIKDGAVAIKDSRIVWIGSQDEIGEQFIPAQTLDASGKVVIPGLVNSHGHWAMTLFRGLADDAPLEAWLDKIWKVEAEQINADTMVAGTELAMVEMIRGGTTCAADMYWYYNESFDAVINAGFRMVNGPSFADIPGFEERKKESYDAAIALLDRYQGQPLVQQCVQAHATYTTNLKILEDIRKIAEDRDLLFITHAAESKGEMVMMQEKYGMTPIEVLDSVGLLTEKTLLAHCVHLSDAEIERMAETGASVAHCPSSNLKLSSGIARVADMLKAGVNVAIGTDGPASNNDLDMFHEAQLAALVQKGVTGDPTVLPAEQVFAMMTIDGARAVGLGDKVGSLEVGKLADLAVIDFDSPNLTPCYDLYSHFIYAAAASDVNDVMIHGKMLMQDRQLLTLDEAEVKAKARRIADKIRLI